MTKRWGSILQHIGGTQSPNNDHEYVQRIHQSFGDDEAPKVIPMSPQDAFNPSDCSNEIQRLNYNIDSIKGQRQSIADEYEKRVSELDEKQTKLEQERATLVESG